MDPGDADKMRAVDLFQRAAAKGNLDAQYNLGVMYEKGQGVRKDYKKAMKWLLLAANQKVAEAQYDIASMYFEGKGVKQDTKVAIEWFRLAAQQGHIQARKYLEQLGEKVPEIQNGKYQKKKRMLLSTASQTVIFAGTESRSKL